MMLILNKDQGEILLDTSYESDLSKHGMRPYVRWGALKETLAAACILESGILQRAQSTGKLYLWDPFCGSGSFLLETLMSALKQPVRSLDGQWPFQQWPVHQRDVFEEFRENMNEIAKIKSHLDIQLVGSDISLRAVEASSNNVKYADLDRYLPQINCAERPIINDPLVYGEHFPQLSSLGVHTPGLISYKEQTRASYLSLYHGDFEAIGQRLSGLTNNFEDFTLLMNIPYGV